jgi:hypothetical protein
MLLSNICRAGPDSSRRRTMASKGPHDGHRYRYPGTPVRGAARDPARIERLLVMARPADLDAGEITDKGYVNQRQVLANRAALVELLYAEPVPAGVVVAERTA